MYAFGFFSGINLTLVFSFNLYFEVYHKKNLLEFEKLIIFGCFAIAAMLAALPIFFYYKNESNACIYIISVMIVTIWLYIRVILAFNKISYPHATQCIKDLAIYPLVGMMMMMLFTSQQILFFVQECYSTFYFILLGIRSVQGFIDVVIYGFNSIVRAEINKKFHKQQQLNINVPISDESNQNLYTY